MPDPSDDLPQIYLVTPPQLGDDFADALARVLDAAPVACLRLDLATRDEDRLLRATDLIRPLTEPREVALVVAEHTGIAERAGLDGVHLRDGSRGVRKARTTLGADAIVGTYCRASRHDGMTAGEAGADYVAFGPVGGVGDEIADADLFGWWSEMIEIPVVAEGGLDDDALRRLAPVADFLAFGEEVWSSENPAARLAEIASVIGRLS